MCFVHVPTPCEADGIIKVISFGYIALGSCEPDGRDWLFVAHVWKHSGAGDDEYAEEQRRQNRRVSCPEAVDACNSHHGQRRDAAQQQDQREYGSASFPEPASLKLTNEVAEVLRRRLLKETVVVRP